MLIVKIIVIIMIEICKKSESMYSTKRKVNYVQRIETVSFDFETIADFELWTYLQNNNFVLGKART